MAEVILFFVKKKNRYGDHKRPLSFADKGLQRF
jgi:hypothetical protein